MSAPRKACNIMNERIELKKLNIFGLTLAGLAVLVLSSISSAQTDSRLLDSRNYYGGYKIKPLIELKYMDKALEPTLTDAQRSKYLNKGSRILIDVDSSQNVYLFFSSDALVRKYDKQGKYVLTVINKGASDN